MKSIAKFLKPIAKGYHKVMTVIAKVLTKKSAETFIASIFSIIVGLLFGWLMLLIFLPESAAGAFEVILFGTFQNGNQAFGNWFYFATPIILTGLSVGFAFKTGLFNIGATGQFTMGAFTAVYIAFFWTFVPGPILWLVALLGAIVAGAIWGFIPGLLKALFNVHEVVSTIMLNYVAFYFVRWGIQLDKLFDGTQKTNPVPLSASIPKMGLQYLFPDSQVTGGIFIAILAFVVIYIVLQKTTFGYQLKAVGFNKDAAKYAGINEKKGIVYSMVIAGALAGLGGALLYLNIQGKGLSLGDGLLPEGFDGIAVALLGNSSPIGVVLAALFLGYIRASQIFLQQFALTKEFITIIVSSIIYFSALSLFFKNFIQKVSKRYVKPFDGGDE